MIDMQGRWSHCQQLAEEFKRRSLQMTSAHATQPKSSDAEKTTAEAVEDLKRRSEDLRQRYGL